MNWIFIEYLSILQIPDCTTLNIEYYKERNLQLKLGIINYFCITNSTKYIYIYRVHLKTRELIINIMINILNIKFFVINWMRFLTVIPII